MTLLISIKSEDQPKQGSTTENQLRPVLLLVLPLQQQHLFLLLLWKLLVYQRCHILYKGLRFAEEDQPQQQRPQQLPQRQLQQLHRQTILITLGNEDL